MRRSTPQERAALAEDRQDFEADYRASRKRPGDFVEARMIGLSGLRLAELERAGFAERFETAYRPK